MSKKRKHTLTAQQKKKMQAPAVESLVPLQEPAKQETPTDVWNDTISQQMPASTPTLSLPDSEHIIEKNPFAQLLGMDLLEIREGYAYGRMRMDEHFSNIYGGMHGGCMYALADTFAGIAASTYGCYVTTVDGKMNYLEPVNDAAYIYCEVHVLRQGGKLGVYAAKITDGGEHLYATADFTFYLLRKKES